MQTKPAKNAVRREVNNAFYGLIASAGKDELYALVKSFEDLKAHNIMLFRTLLGQALLRDVIEAVYEENFQRTTSFYETPLPEEILL